MSVVVAIKEKGKIIMGCDSQVTRGESYNTLKSINNYKIWKVKNTDHCLMGHTGRVRNSNIVRLMDELIKEGETIDFELVVKSVVPRIVEELLTYRSIEDKERIEDIGSSFILAYKDKLFLIYYDCSVIEIDDYIAVGSGECEAMGVLNITEGENPKTRIIKAIQSASKGNLYVSYPIIISDTKNMEYEIIEEGGDRK